MIRSLVALLSAAAALALAVPVSATPAPAIPQTSVAIPPPETQPARPVPEGAPRATSDFYVDPQGDTQAVGGAGGGPVPVGRGGGGASPWASSDAEQDRKFLVAMTSIILGGLVVIGLVRLSRPRDSATSDGGAIKNKG